MKKSYDATFFLVSASDRRLSFIEASASLNLDLNIILFFSFVAGFVVQNKNSTFWLPFVITPIQNWIKRDLISIHSEPLLR